MQIFRTYDANLADRILRDDDVFANSTDDHCPSKDKISLSSVLSNRNNLCLVVDIDGQPAGMFICIHCSDHCYEGHIALLPACRGKDAIEAIRLAVNWVFLNTKATRIVGPTPASNRPALWAIRQAGFTKVAIRERTTKIGGKDTHYIISEITLHQWLEQNYPTIRIHGLDAWQSKHLAFSISAALAGNPEKAILTLDEMNKQTYAKQIDITDFPIIRIGDQAFHIIKSTGGQSWQLEQQ